MLDLLQIFVKDNFGTLCIKRLLNAVFETDEDVDILQISFPKYFVKFTRKHPESLFE